jgi:glycosyltransferase involved in cell wall biosynthesis
MTDGTPLRILFVAHHVIDRNAGVGGTTLALHDALRAQGHAVHTYGYQDAFPDGTSRASRYLFPWRVAAFLAREGHRFDVVDATTGDAWVWLARRTGGPRIVTRAHGLEHVAYAALMAHVARGEDAVSSKFRLYTGGYRLWEVGNSVRAADGVIMLNARDAAYARTRWHIAPERLFVTVNAVSDGLRTLPAPTRASSDTRPLQLAFVGSWIPRKGIARIAGIADTLVDAAIPFRLDLLGTGQSANEVLAGFSTAARASVRVRPSYGQQELPALLRDAHVLLHPSWSEGFSVALIEGMACGLAPLATDAGASRELLGTGTAGILIDPPSVEEFVRELRMLDADRDRLHAMRVAAHAGAVAPSWERIAGETAAFYRSLPPR